MSVVGRCPECGAEWADGTKCVDHFHRMLAWEIETPSLGEVHHLMVLCYHMQHPSLYSPEGLEWAKRFLVDFVEGGVTTEEARRRNRASLDSGSRSYRIRGTRASRGGYAHPVTWTVTGPDVTAGGTGMYCENVRTWSLSILQALRDSGNLPPKGSG